MLFNKALVCMLVNHEYGFGWNSFGKMIRLSIGRNASLHINIDNSNPNRRPIELNPHINPDYQKIVDTLAHECGHAFRLGDEYEEFKKAADANIDDTYDNITHLDDIAKPAPHDPNWPTPIDPNLIKWAKVHRITKADTLIQPSVINGNQITVTLAVGKATSWRAVKEAETKIFLRKYVNRQLPIAAADLYQNLDIHDIPDDHTLVLTGQAGPVSFPAGSVIYVPRRDNSDIATLVKRPVFQYMESQRYKDDAAFSQGIALSENHNRADPLKSDPVQWEPDSPPDIPDFKEPCQGFKLIGAYEGGAICTIKVFRPSGACKMRSHYGADSEGEFCFVCKYLLVNRIDPSKHVELDALYPDGKDK